MARFADEPNPRCSRDGSQADAGERGRRGAAQGYEHDVEIREHRLITDEPEDSGGTDRGPAHRAARRIARLLRRDHDRDVRRPQGMGPGRGRGDRRLHRDDQPTSRPGSTSQSGSPTELDDEQRERILVIAGKCPVHRALGADDVEINDRSSRRGVPVDLGLAGAPASSPAPAAGSAAPPRGCSAPRAPRCCSSPAPRTRCCEAADECAAAGQQSRRRGPSAGARRHRRGGRRAGRRGGRRAPRPARRARQQRGHGALARPRRRPG